jgi:myosin heavy subunit
MRMDGKSLRIYYSSLKNYFLEKSRIIVQSLHERNFHIFYQLLSYLPEDQRGALRLKSGGQFMRFDDFKYLTNRNSSAMNEDRKMWDELNKAFASL